MEKGGNSNYIRVVLAQPQPLDSSKRTGKKKGKTPSRCMGIPGVCKVSKADPNKKRETKRKKKINMSSSFVKSDQIKPVPSNHAMVWNKQSLRQGRVGWPFGALPLRTIATTSQKAPTLGASETLLPTLAPVPIGRPLWLFFLFNQPPSKPSNSPIIRPQASFS